VLDGQSDAPVALQAPALRALETLPMATIQDAGRVGWMRWGVSGGGAMDLQSLASANALVGNDNGEAALEFALAGGIWEIEAHSCRVAVCGGQFSVFVDNARQEPYTSLTLRRGQMLRITAAPDAIWGYLAVAGGFELPEALGSRSTLLRAGIGGFHGRALTAGDRLILRTQAVAHARTRALPPPVRAAAELRVVLGPQDDHFEHESLRHFINSDWRVSTKMDRMGYNLIGPILKHSDKGANIVSDGVVAGSVQVPASGQPIALMMDRQPTGGYPKIATVVTADLGRLAQCRPGETVRFRPIPVHEAVAARRSFTAAIANLRAVAEAPRPVFVKRRRPLQDVIANSER
jgi:biotin-dependent carboxylase-like uncharacterized protein